MSWNFGFRPYVPVARRQANAVKYAAKLAKKEKRTLAPVAVAGRNIAASFWGQAWCENLEGYSDYENRLPRGRTYVRNGSVIDLQMENGQVKALVSGSEVYRVAVDIKTLPPGAWSRIKQDCARCIDSLIDLLQGRFDEGIMRRLSQRDGGLFPTPKEIKMRCSCPDWAGMCKHVAATLYGVGARLDTAPELLFTLRGVDHLELISQAVDSDNLNRAFQGKADTALRDSDLGAIFGIELDGPDRPQKEAKRGATAVSADATAPTKKTGAGKKPAGKEEKEKKTGRADVTKLAVKSVRRLSKTPKKASTLKKKSKGASATS